MIIKGTLYNDLMEAKTVANKLEPDYPKSDLWNLNESIRTLSLLLDSYSDISTHEHYYDNTRGCDSAQKYAYKKKMYDLKTGISSIKFSIGAAKRFLELEKNAALKIFIQNNINTAEKRLIIFEENYDINKKNNGEI